MLKGITVVVVASSVKSEVLIGEVVPRRDWVLVAIKVSATAANAVDVIRWRGVRVSNVELSDDTAISRYTASREVKS